MGGWWFSFDCNYCRLSEPNTPFVLSALKPQAEGCIEGLLRFDTALRFRSAPTQRKRVLSFSSKFSPYPDNPANRSA